MTHIEINDISFIYPNGKRALDNVSLTIEKGEKVAILGQNGAGKTTLVRLINGLLKPTTGQIFVNGKDTHALSAAKIARDVSYAFQNPDDQIFNKDVYSEIAFGLKNAQIGEDEIERRVQSAARLCMIDRLLDENPYDLSLSARRSVTIASVIARDTDVVILDEPTAGQDMRGIECLRKIIDNLNHNGKTVITITHDMEFAADNFNRCVVMAHTHKIGDSDAKSIFWDSKILSEANLRQPHSGSLCKKLGIEERILSIDEFARYLESRRASLA